MSDAIESTAKPTSSDRLDASASCEPNDEVRRAETRIAIILALLQFVNVLCIAIVTPLGPDIALALDIPMSRLGMVVASFTFAAALSGVAGAFYLDRVDRRLALTVTLAGLAVVSGMASWANDIDQLIIARAVAGLFGGPTAALILAVLADRVHPDRRGRATGIVMTAFSAATVLGVPLGLELSRRGGWRLPFIALAGLLLCGAMLAFVFVPKSGSSAAESTREDESPPTLLGGSSLRAFWLIATRPLHLQAFTSIMLSMFGMFLMIPNLAAYLQQNLGFDRAHLGALYAMAGLLTLATIRLIGRGVDRFGSAKMATFGAGLIGLVTWAGYVRTPSLLPIPLVFGAFMFASAIRNVSTTTLATRVPHPSERARFTSMQTTIQHVSSALGAFASSQILSVDAQGNLVGMGAVATLAIASFSIQPLVLWAVEIAVKRRDEIPMVWLAETERV